MYHDSTEVDEQKYPIHVDVKRLIPDSEGPGRHRGAFGSEVVYGPKDLPMMIAYTFEGHENPARGVRGGLAGAPSDGWKLDPAATESTCRWRRRWRSCPASGCCHAPAAVGAMATR